MPCLAPVAPPARLAARCPARVASRRTAARPVAAASLDAAPTPAAPARPPPPTWSPARLPSSLPELISLASSPAVAETLADTTTASYLAYSVGRGAFFTAQAIMASALTTGALAGFTQRLERQAASLPSASGDWIGSGMGLAGLLASQAELYRREAEHIKAGLYKAPYDSDLRHRQFNPAFIADKAARLLRASGETMARRDAPGGGTEVLRTATDAAVETRRQPGVAAPGEVLYPDYYLQNYHWQTDGWMSAKSAAAYEAQTETLFQGCQDAMQRAALVPLARYMAGRDPAATTLLEVAAGTGRFHTFIKDNWPMLRTTCSELSPYYLAAARENMEYFATEFNPLVNPGREMARTAFVQCAAEALPFEDAAFDVLMNVYLYHELPMEARIAATAEFARVLRPGGLCVINDSLQRGDRAEMDAVMPRFSELYHEPHHLDYTETDMVALFDAAGFSCVDIQLAHVSKVWAFVRR